LKESITYFVKKNKGNTLPCNNKRTLATTNTKIDITSLIDISPAYEIYAMLLR
jgi:hypothetical protein